MSTAPINLNKVRKAKARADQRRKADENAVAFGRTKAEKDLARARMDKATRDHQGHKRET